MWNCWINPLNTDRIDIPPHPCVTCVCRSMYLNVCVHPCCGFVVLCVSAEGKKQKVSSGSTFPTYCMSVPVYSSNKKNWFHIHPRLERLSGTPLASCPVSPVDPLRPPVVLRRALSPDPGELRWATAHSTISTYAFLLSMATTPPPPSVVSPPQRSVSSGFWSEYRIRPHAVIYWSRNRSSHSHRASSSTWNIYREKQSVNTGRRGGNLLPHRLSLRFITGSPDRLSRVLGSFEEAVLWKIESGTSEDREREHPRLLDVSFQKCFNKINTDIKSRKWNYRQKVWNHTKKHNE